MSIARPVAEMLSTYTTQIEAASSLNEEFDLVTLRKSIIRWCQLILSNKAMALIGVIELLKQTRIVNYNYLLYQPSMAFRRYNACKGRNG